LNGHNPDILTCLANLSADEVFTPPKLASAMLDLLPPDLFRRPDTTFLDPFCKSGVFLREIARRLNDGLKDQMPDEQARINHILTKQVFGLATGELTALLSRRSLYCSKKADGKYSIATAFTKPDGNVRLPKTQHTWNSNGRCESCGANRGEYDRDETLEAYAYPFIHGIDPTEEFNVTFDVIVGNPPYQLSDGGGTGTSARPIYHLFIQQAKKLAPQYLSMIVPSRWFAGGKGLDDFRSEMLADDRLRKLVDFESATDVFPGVDIAGGVSYFLWDRDSNGPCEIINNAEGQSYSTTRRLNEFEIFVRSSRAIPIIHKIIAATKSVGRLSDVVSTRQPFGIDSTYKPRTDGVPCWFIQRIGRQFVSAKDVTDTGKILKKWKLLIPKAPIAGQTDFSKPIRFYYDENTRISKPGECCTESWLVACAFSSAEEVLSFKSYLFTKIVRFLTLQTVISQNMTRKNFAFVPDLGHYEGSYSDEMLRNRWGITADEWAYIDSKIG